MKAAALFFLASLTLAGCGPSDLGPSTTPAAQPVNNAWVPSDPALLSAELQGHVDRALAQNHIPGALVGVWTPKGSWTSATGVAEVATQRPMDRGDFSAWRSITKSFTVTIVLELVAEGRLDLDKPVSTYASGVPNGNVITLRHLANMTSGLYNYTADETFRQTFGADPTRPWTTPQLLSLAFAHPVNFQPGMQYEYSNTNTLLLGWLAESRTGLSFEELLQTRVYSRLGLTSTRYINDTEVPPPSALGYAYDPNLPGYVNVVVHFSGLGEAGAMAGSLNDLHAWGRALALGTLLPPSLHQQRFVSRPPTNGPEYDSYGLGMGQIRGWWGHTGNGAGYEAAVFTDPNSGSSVAIMLNGSNSNGDVPADIFRQILDSLKWPN